MTCDDGDPCTNDTCSDGACNFPDKCPGQNCCADGTCCDEACDECVDNGALSGGEVTVEPDPACIDDTITFTVTGVVDSGGQKRENCQLVNIPAGTIEYTWEITKPDSTTASGSGPSAGVVADQGGVYSCTFTTSVDRDCAPDSLSIGPAAKTLTFSATLTLNPSSIAATTAWPDMPASLNQSYITVTWDPPECVGSLEIVEIVGTEGYVPPGNGTLEKVNDTLWRYTAYPEPQSELCAKSVNVWIGVMQGDDELARKSILVLPVHTFFITGANTDYQKDYDYITWKYAAVLATTQGGFYSVTISPNPCVGCPLGCVYACTWCIPGVGYSVIFGTLTFTGSENQAASIIGHELVHTTGADECPAYTWELDHDDETGIFPCDSVYLHSTLLKKIQECGE